MGMAVDFFSIAVKDGGFGVLFGDGTNTVNGGIFQVALPFPD